MIVSVTLLAGSAASRACGDGAGARTSGGERAAGTCSDEAPALAPFAEELWVVERLDPQEAAAQARAAGLAAMVSLPSPVKCPPIVLAGSAIGAGGGGAAGCSAVHARIATTSVGAVHRVIRGMNGVIGLRTGEIKAARVSDDAAAVGESIVEAGDVDAGGELHRELHYAGMTECEVPARGSYDLRITTMRAL